MNCYHHQDKAAIGICKSCMKGVCSECATEIGNGLACKNSCENEVMLINQAQANQPKVQKYGNAVRILGPLFLAVYGLYISASWSGVISNQKDYGLVGMGLVCIVFGAALAYKGAINSHKNV
jgi:hypothetical protein